MLYKLSISYSKGRKYIGYTSIKVQTAHHRQAVQLYKFMTVDPSQLARVSCSYVAPYLSDELLDCGQVPLYGCHMEHGLSLFVPLKKLVN